LERDTLRRVRHLSLPARQPKRGMGIKTAKDDEFDAFLQSIQEKRPILSMQ
jgi:hypothetical protein